MKRAALLCMILSCNFLALAQIDSLFRFRHTTPEFSAAVDAAISAAVIANPADTEEGGTVNSLQRYQFLMNSRISNDVPLGADRFDAYNKAAKSYLLNFNTNCNNVGGDWHCLGPFNDNWDVSYEQQGRVNAIWVSPNDTNHILLGADAGGLWESNDAGHNWHCITDGSHMPMGVYCIAVNPKDSNNIYIALGITSQYKKSWDINMGIAYTSDGGATWQLDTAFNTATGDTVLPRVTKVAFMPGTQRLYAIHNGQVMYKASPTSSWADVTPASLGVGQYNVYDMDFSKATGKKVIITTTPSSSHSKVCVFDTSTGVWTTMTVTLPAPYSEVDWDSGGGDGIINFGVTSTDTLYCEVRARNSATGNSLELALMRTPLSSLNLQLRQASLDNRITDFDVSPANSHILYFVQYQSYLQRYDDVSHTFTTIGNGHIDARSLHIYNCQSNPTNDVVYYGNDGGIRKKRYGQDYTSGITGAGLAISEFYGMGSSDEDDEVIAAGAQDNGGFSYMKQRSPNWEVDDGGRDGYVSKMMVNGVKKAFGEANCLCTDHPMYELDFNDNNTTTEYGLVEPPDPYGSSIIRPQFFDPKNNAYVGYNYLWKKLPDTAYYKRAFIKDPIDVSPFGTFPKAVADFYIDDNDSSFVYLAYGGTSPDATQDTAGRLFFSLHAYSATPNWLNITPTVADTNTINAITVDPRHPGRIWVGFGDINVEKINASPSAMTHRVLYSSDTGHTWTDVSHGLSALPVNKLLFRKCGDDEIYAGTDVGVFKWNKGSQEWECFNNGLPAAIIMDMEFNYCSGKLRVATYGKGIWETDMYDQHDVPPFSDSILTNTTWSKSRHIAGNVFVKSGASLTIQNTGGDTTIIHMPRNGAILVDKHATLTVNGATITNDCNNCMWKGILGDGDTYASQTSTNQPTIILTGATIEHARRGVMNFPESFPNGNFTHAGAIIHAYNTHFLNCNTGASLSLYEHNLDYAVTPTTAYDAYFTKCTFEITDEYRGHGSMNYPFNAMAQLVGVQGVKFTGCQFLNRDHNNQNRGKGYGIFCYDGGARIQSYCNGISFPCDSWLRTQFTGFGTGIKASGTLSGWYTVFTDGADFDSCTIGIKTEHFNNVTTVHSTFKIGDGTPQELFDGSCHQNIGIWHSYSEVFGVEDNTFNGYTYYGQPSDMQNMGVIVENSVLPAQENAPFQPVSSFHNEIYRNYFDSLNKACWSIGLNAFRNNQAQTYADNNGLMFLCNTYRKNDSSIVIAGGSLDGVAVNQGYDSLAAGNTFDTVGGHNYFKNSCYFIRYYYPGYANPTIYKPTRVGTTQQINSVILLPIPYWWPNTCADHYTTSIPLGNDAKSFLKVRWHALGPVRDSLIAAYNNLIDCGSTGELRAYIDTMTTDSAVAVHDALLNCSPYLSKEVLADVTGLGILSTSQLMDLYLANPEMLQQQDLVKYITTTLGSDLSSSDIDALSDSSQNITERSHRESQIVMISDSMALAANLLITDMKTDTTYADIDSLPVWLYNQHAEWSDYDLVGYYYYRNQVDSGLAVLERIPVRYGFDTLLATLFGGGGGSAPRGVTANQLYEVVNYVGYTWIYNILSNVNTSGRSIDSLTTGEIDTLAALAHLGDSYPLRAAQAAGGIIKLHLPWYILCAEAHLEDGGIKIGDKPGRTDTTTNIFNNLLAASNKPSSNELYKNEHTSSKLNNVKAYPNPAKDYVMFDYNTPSTTGPVALIITDTKGVAVRKFELSKVSGQVRWETTNVLPGVYYYQIRDNNGPVKNGKIVIMK